MIKTYYKNGDSVTTNYRALRGDYDWTIMYNYAINKQNWTERFARSVKNIAIVGDSVAEDSNVSIPLRSQELELSYGTLWSILHLDLHLHPCKI